VNNSGIGAAVVRNIEGKQGKRNYLGGRERRGVYYIS